MKRMIAIGDNVADHYMDEEIYYPGGNAVNVAVGCKRNGFDEVAYIGVFGTDKQAHHIQWALARENVSFDYSRFMQGISGCPQVKLDEHGDRRFVFSPKNTVQHLVGIRLTAEDIGYIETFDVCHTSCYSNLDYELPKLKGKCDVSYDFSDLHDDELLERVCPHIRFGLFSGSDLTASQVDDLIKKATGLGTEVVGITLGSRGALFHINGKNYEQGIKKANVVDTMGAGDSFIAGFLTAFYQGDSPEECLDKAAQSAADTCGQDGGFGYGRPFGT